MITRPTVQQSRSLIIDLGVVIFVAACLYGIVKVAQRWEAPLQPQVQISLSLWALPRYTLLSLLRGFAAYGLSLVFALTYGYLAAHRPRAERVMLPLLDILQSIPVLGFLPGAVLALVALFPNTNAGLEIASILMIFTGQVWNMTFSVYQSLRAIPEELVQAASVYQFNWWQRFRRLELPAAAVGLAWNSMMSMAGGWFFLMVCEAFTLGEHDFRLPGLGAYISVAASHRDLHALLAGLLAMATMVVAVDTLIWRPVLVWAQRFRLEDTAGTDLQSSFVLTWLRQSRLLQAAKARLAHPVSEWLSAHAAAERQRSKLPTLSRHPWVGHLLNGLLTAAALGLTFGAAWRLAHLLGQLPLSGWWEILVSSLLTWLRVSAAVVLSTLWTVPVGMWIGRSDRRCARLQPLVQVVASFPAPMLYPVLIIAFQALGWGLGWGAILLMMIGIQWYILFNVIAGASTVSQDLREVAQAFRFTPRQSWRTIWWPAVFPYLITGWVTATGGAWNASIVAEYVTLGKTTFIAPGLGSLISVAASQGRYDLLAASVLTMAVAVVMISRYVWKPLYRLASTRYAY